MGSRHPSPEIFVDIFTGSPRHGMPTRHADDAVLNFARERGALQPHVKGSAPPYLWPLLEIIYLCRMRSIEVVQLTEAHASELGLYVARAKGSNDNIVKWTPRLKAAAGPRTVRDGT